MSYAGQYSGQMAYEVPVMMRMEFIRKTYGHLTGAIGFFALLSYAFYKGGIGEAMVKWLSGSGSMMWLVILGGFMIMGWLGTTMSSPSNSTGVQYAGLGIYAIAQAIIFAPLIFIAARFYPEALPTASLLTALVFGGLTAYVLVTRKDFSFLRGMLVVGGLVALGLILCGVLFGFELGIWFSGAMILFASASILYSTSNVLHHFRVGQHVGASLQLFASVMLLFWYILQFIMQMSRD